MMEFFIFAGIVQIFIALVMLGKAHRRKEVACYNAPNRNVDFRPTISNPLEVSGLNRYDED